MEGKDFENIREEDWLEDMVEALFKGDVTVFERIIRYETISQEKMTDAVIDGLARCILQGRIETYHKLKNHFHLSDYLTQKIAEKVIANSLTVDFVETLASTCDFFHLTPSQTKNAALKAMSDLLSSGNVASAFGIPNAFELSLESVQKIARKAMRAHLAKGNISSFCMIKETFKFNDRIYNSPKYKRMAVRGAFNSLLGDMADNAREIAKLFPCVLENKEVIWTATSVLASLIAVGRIDEAKRIHSSFRLAGEALRDAARKAVSRCLSEGKSGLAYDIRQIFSLRGE